MNRIDEKSPPGSSEDPARRERQRLLDVYAGRERQLGSEAYAPWKVEEIFMRTGRRRAAARLLTKAGAVPKPGDACLEVGYGSLGWLGELICWGVREEDLHGIELDDTRAQRARNALPLADLRVGDASAMPWPDGTFRLVIASTVFTSILDPVVRRMVAGELDRVLAPGGALLWYDFAVNNPRNPDVRGIGREAVRALFPSLRGTVRSVTLAPPLARFIAPRSWWMATVLEEIPLLRTHLIAVLQKNR